jgi:hypothetical protein
LQIAFLRSEWIQLKVHCTSKSCCNPIEIQIFIIKITFFMIALNLNVLIMEYKFIKLLFTWCCKELSHPDISVSNYLA